MVHCFFCIVLCFHCFLKQSLRNRLFSKEGIDMTTLASRVEDLHKTLHLLIWRYCFAVEGKSETQTAENLLFYALKRLVWYLFPLSSSLPCSLICSLGAYVRNESPVGMFCWKQETALDMLREPQRTEKYMLPVLQPALGLFRGCFRNPPFTPHMKTRLRNKTHSNFVYYGQIVPKIAGET